jgi:hypothetical protein
MAVEIDPKITDKHSSGIRAPFNIFGKQTPDMKLK